MTEWVDYFPCLVKQLQSYHAQENHHWSEDSHTQHQLPFLTSDNLKFAFVILVYLNLHLSPDLHLFTSLFKFSLFFLELDELIRS